MGLFVMIKGSCQIPHVEMMRLAKTIVRALFVSGRLNTPIGKHQIDQVMNVLINSGLFEVPDD